MEIRSLTNWLKELQSKQWSFFGTERFRDNQYNPLLSNPAPTFIYKRKLWLLFGTYVDYIIRKFFRDKLISPSAEIVCEDKLIAEIGLDSLYNEDMRLFLPMQGNDLNYFTLNPNENYKIDFITEITESHGLSYEANETAFKVGSQWIKNYKNNTWDKVIYETWRMAGLDNLYRTGNLPTKHLLNDQEILELKAFLSNVLEWLQNHFSSAKKIFLNPTLGYPGLVKADADLIIDCTLWDIKTTKNPKQAPFNDVNQLLGYASLVFHHTKNKTQNFPYLSTVGFLFPQ